MCHLFPLLEMKVIWPPKKPARLTGNGKFFNKNYRMQNCRNRCLREFNLCAPFSIRWEVKMVQWICGTDRNACSHPKGKKFHPCPMRTLIPSSLMINMNGICSNKQPDHCFPSASHHKNKVCILTLFSTVLSKHSLYVCTGPNKFIHLLTKMVPWIEVESLWCGSSLPVDKCGVHRSHTLSIVRKREKRQWIKDMGEWRRSRVCREGA